MLFFKVKNSYLPCIRLRRANLIASGMTIRTNDFPARSPLSYTRKSDDRTPGRNRSNTTLSQPDLVQRSL